MSNPRDWAESERSPPLVCAHHVLSNASSSFSGRNSNGAPGYASTTARMSSIRLSSWIQVACESCRPSALGWCTYLWKRTRHIHMAHDRLALPYLFVEIARVLLSTSCLVVVIAGCKVRLRHQIKQSCGTSPTREGYNK